ncbi:hypothetical protein C362_05894 [Cryptococcus neoformans Bt1]|nr:hypothetical protein C362_05894 [Cryptococcus neoformans var. grubii Bt1]
MMMAPKLPEDSTCKPIRFSNWSLGFPIVLLASVVTSLQFALSIRVRYPALISSLPSGSLSFLPPSLWPRQRMTGKEGGHHKSRKH